MPKFKIHSDYAPTGDQPEAIKRLTDGVLSGEHLQVLLGVTGSGKTYTMANVIERTQRPTLVIAHNKTLAAQLCAELREFFPENCVEYFVSYYDYYQPEAYIASSDTYIDKVASINDEIDRLRHSATSALNERRDVIIVASVSCIYALGNPAEYVGQSLSLRKDMVIDRNHVIRKLIDMQYQRNEIEFARGIFRVRGDIIEIFPVNRKEKALRIIFFGDEIERICEISPVNGHIESELSHVVLFPATHYSTNKENMDEAIHEIESDLEREVNQLRENDKLVEAQRLQQRTMYDIDMMREIGYCQGVENYSRYFDGRKPGQPPFTLLDYFPKDYLMFIDESHVTIPQIRGMYFGDKSRKDILVEYGFRLEAARDNRPLKFNEFEERVNQLICVSATPAEYELSRSESVAEQIIRPTGLVDPVVAVKPVEGQVDDLIGEIRATSAKGFRVLVTTLTKRMAEMLTEYLDGLGIRVRYMHSEIQTIERMEIIRDLRLGEFDVLVGINLLREGLDLPEVGLVAILDADKEGFLRSTTSLIQTIGRAARNVEGRVIMYADNITDSMRLAIDETERRRAIQIKYNTDNNITPKSIVKKVHDVMKITTKTDSGEGELSKEQRERRIAILTEEMAAAVRELEFEHAAKIRDELFRLQGKDTKGTSAVKPGTVGSKKAARQRKRK
ncbi:MAG: excinuclease ABC subunit UvrB [Eubacteriales bacterium]|nr:excinuclease ABC subunit UvrB [Clostridia bacterium]MDY5754909.1 excinuclease ABC subunit UvrB [Eubacteriales bacterium]